MEPFKNLLNPALVTSTGARLKHVHAGFDRALFDRVAMQGLPVPVQGISTARSDVSDGLAGWIVWPLGEFVAGAGLARPERSLKALHALTQRLTAEFSIRPFIVAHPERVFATLLHWTQDPSAHVRRLASEGSRPRLPWGLRLQSLVVDPTPTMPILAALQDDPSEYVRRSVANHWNDIAKDHPGLVVRWVREHLAGASAERNALVKTHSLRPVSTRTYRVGMHRIELWANGVRCAEASFELRV